ncbi:RCC1 and BTB domain-containing protein 1-like [Oppia nitens]|uniref:RCC1 and BTB domain-containing protein 1-like n=1 Tax=Oppia nitens TaxID=1686743 RepID=UPI0023DCBDD5|nr:RCC1 and BTB domain-containing protein 1-like [Oppia nitens]
MSAIDLFNKFSLCNEISLHIKYEIKLFHYSYNNVWFVTNDDQVYGLGYNQCGIFGLGHNIDVNQPQVIPELCQKNINKFSIGTDFALCITSDQQIYSWGCNGCKQLCRHTSDEYSKPAIITFLSDKCIIDITCGSYHSLALTSAGTVYGWGYNRYGQCGCEQEFKCIDSPTRVIFHENIRIKSIYCYNCCSFAITSDGLVYSWGDNQDNQLGHKNLYLYKPIEIK